MSKNHALCEESTKFGTVIVLDEAKKEATPKIQITAVNGPFSVKARQKTGSAIYILIFYL
jgi:predicted RNA-binding protein with TRAM domain